VSCEDAEAGSRELSYVSGAIGIDRRPLYVLVFFLIGRLLTIKLLLANLDVALLNFMLDWFPVESKEKLKSNEQEAAKEHLEELGVDPDACVIM
jgi:hypothetical protein